MNNIYQQIKVLPVLVQLRSLPSYFSAAFPTKTQDFNDNNHECPCIAKLSEMIFMLIWIGSSALAFTIRWVCHNRELVYRRLTGSKKIKKKARFVKFEVVVSWLDYWAAAQARVDYVTSFLYHI